jgi:hypothetical protein
VEIADNTGNFPTSKGVTTSRPFDDPITFLGDSMSNLKRSHFSVARAAEYFDIKELVPQTGQPSYKFGEVVLKELIDNALDACESASIEPVINIGVAIVYDRMMLCVSDNGVGMSEQVINSILDFDTRTSDKAAYKAPTRGAQGNAFKTIIGIPYALGGGSVGIESFWGLLDSCLAAPVGGICVRGSIALW